MKKKRVKEFGQEKVVNKKKRVNKFDQEKLKNEKGVIKFD